MKAVYYGRELWQSSDYDKNKYGIPELKKYPMPDREHVKSAIRFFNYVEPRYERELAENIIKRIQEYHMTDISVGPDNRFGKYWQDDSLSHHGIIGMKWGVWNEETRARYLGGNRGGNKGFGMKGSENNKSSDSKYFNGFMKKLNEKALMKDLESDEEFQKKLAPKQTKVAHEMLKDNSYGAFIYGEINRVNHSDQLVDRFYSIKDHGKTARTLTKDNLNAYLQSYFPNFYTKQELTAIWEHVSTLANYSDSCDKLFDEEIEKMGFSDSKKESVKEFMHKMYVQPWWLLRVQNPNPIPNLDHADFSKGQYYAVDLYNPYTTANHHGIIGMKWGVWNEETRARYLGGNGRRSSGMSTDTNTNSKGSSKLGYSRKTEHYESTIKEIEADAKKVNGGLAAALFAQNRDNNCAYCTAAYELRRRGYDVKAAEAIYGVDLISHPDLMFKGAKANLLVDNTDYKRDKDGNYVVDKNGNKQLSFSARLFSKGGITRQQFAEIERELVKQGEGARGNIFGMFVGSAYAGHSMAYEIVNGKLCIIDAQVGTVHDGSSITKNPYQDLQNFRELYYTRTDNLRINDELIGNFVTDSSTKTKVDGVKIAKDILATASWFVPGAGLAYYALSAGDAVANRKKNQEAYENVVKRGY